MIDYQYIDDIKDDETLKDIVITDGIVSVTGTTYTVSGQTIVITNDLIESNFTIRQKLCTQEQLRFGSCESAECSMSIFDNIPTLKDKVLKVYIYVNRDASTMLQLGIFKVTQDRLTADRTKREILMYDAMHDILNADVKSWYDTVLPNANSSVTIKQFRDSFLNHFSITPEITTLVNDDITIKRSIESDTISGADVITYICEFNGCFGTITNEGKFRFLYLSQGIDSGVFPSETLYPSDTLYPEDINHDVTSLQKSSYFSINFEDYLCESITQLIVRTDDESGAVAVGVDGNTYVISSNFLFYGLSSSVVETVATNILSKITNCYYKACDVECIGNPCLELGDPIRISTTYRGIVTYVLEKNMSGIKVITDEYTARGRQKYEEDQTSVFAQIRKTNGRIVSLKADTEKIEGRVESIEDGSASVIQQLSDNISAKVSQEGGNPNSFSWELLYNAFKLYSNGNEVFNCDSSGVTVTGKLVARDYGSAEIVEGRLFLSNGSGKYADLGVFGLDFGSLNGAVLAIEADYSGGSTPDFKLWNVALINGYLPIHSGNIGSAHVAYADYASSSGNSLYTEKLLNTSNGNSVEVNSYGNFVPVVSGMRCGGSQGKWSEVWAENGTIQTSDRNLKNSIETIDDRYIEFMRRLVPKRFKMNSGTSGRYHMGFIAQDVEELLEKCEISSAEFAGLIKDVYTDDDGNEVEYYALRYSEFIAPLIEAWQNTEARLESLEARLKKLEQEANSNE